MDRLKIDFLIKNIADKYGYSNKQQLDQLESKLNSYDQDAVFWGLINQFKGRQVLPSDRQELAGRMLYRLSPKVNIDVKSELREVLANFDPSVEHLPFYFAARFGVKEVGSVLKELQSEDLSDAEIESIDTMMFWLKNFEKWRRESN